MRKYPAIKTNLRIAHNRTPPEKFVKKALRLSLYGSLVLGVLTFFIFSRNIFIGKLLLIVAAVVLVSFSVFLVFILQSPKSDIRKRQREIDKEVLFAGRYLLVKMEAGTPLINTLSDASKSYGISGKYFGEIVDDINTGVPMEEALENARRYSPSDKLKRILWQLVTVLKTGSEVTGVLKGTLKSIAAEQAIEIKKFGKKMNSIMLFYMIIACVMPSLGLTMLVIISGFLNFTFSNVFFLVILFFLAVVQIAFIILVKSSRPMVDV